jgi:hypothetical protein
MSDARLSMAGDPGHTMRGSIKSDVVEANTVEETL